MTERTKPAEEYEEEIRVANVIQAMDSVGKMNAARALGSTWHANDNRKHRKPSPEKASAADE